MMKNKNLKLYIYEYIKRHKKLPPHEKKLDSKFAYYCRILQEEGVLLKKGYGVWEVVGELKTTSKKSIVGKPYQTRITPKNKRGHGFRVSIQLPEIKNWDKRQLWMDKVGMKYRKIKQGQAVDIKGYNVWICSRSIKIHFPKEISLFAESAYECQNHAYNLSFTIARHIEQKFNIRISKGNKYVVRDTYGHYGDVGNELAKKLHRENKTLYVYGYDGKLWLSFDFSWKQFIEAETTHKERGVEDMDAVISPFFNDLRENPTTISELKKEIYDMIKSQAFVSKEFQDNIVKYIKEKEHR